MNTKLSMKRDAKDKVMLKTKVKVRGKEMARNVRGMGSTTSVVWFMFLVCLAGLLMSA